MIEKTIEHLRVALYATLNAVNEIESSATALYVPSGFDAIGESCMERAIYAYKSIHHIEGKDGNSSVQQPGLIYTDNRSIIAIIDQANDARLQFGESFAQLNKTEGYILKAGNAVHNILKKSFELYPLVTKSKPISSKHLSRRFLILENVKHIGFYSEKLIRTETVNATKLNKQINEMPDNSRDLYRNLLTGIKVSDLRYRYESSSVRHRVNVQFNDGRRKNFSVSCPVIVVGESAPEVRTSDLSSNDRSSRNDKSNFDLIIKELRLYVKQ